MSTRSGAVDGEIVCISCTGGSVAEIEPSSTRSLASGPLGAPGRVEQHEARARPGLGSPSASSPRLAAAVPAISASLGGLDALAFTAGVGRGRAGYERPFCAHLEFYRRRARRLLNAEARPDAHISRAGSCVASR